jgi:anti-sigma B factor antagonist
MATMNSGPKPIIQITEPVPGQLVLRISGVLDIASASGLDGLVHELVERSPERVDVDLSVLDFMDSSGIAVLLSITNHFGPVDVFGASNLIRRIIEVTGLTEVLRLKSAPL